MNRYYRLWTGSLLLIAVFWLMTDDYRLLTDSLLPIIHHSSVYEAAKWAGAFKDGEKEK